MKLSVKQKLKFVALSCGVFICHCVFGIIQERIFKIKYSNEEENCSEYFKFSTTFVAIQTAFNSIFALVLSRLQKLETSNEQDHAHKKHFLLVAIFHLTAMLTSTMSLRYISYPTQIVTKAAKPIAVMVLSVIIAKKSYTPQKYLFVFLIVASVAIFIVDGEGWDSTDNERLGIILVVGSLFLDGFTGATQDRIRSKHRPSTFDFMYYVNYWSFMILMCVLSVTGEGRDFIEFAQKYPLIIIHITFALFLGAFGQYFLSAIISNFGALTLALVTTTRKFFNVLLSVISFNNNLTLYQWIATAVIFASLLLDSFFGKKSSSSDNTGNTTSQSDVTISIESTYKNEEKIHKTGIITEDQNQQKIEK